MVELLSTFTGTQVIIFIAMILLAGKELLTAIDFFKKRNKDVIDKEYEEKDEKEEILERLKDISLKIETHNQKFDDISNRIDKQQETLNALIASDIEDIKSDLVKQYHYFMGKQWIDDFSLDVVEKRFARYKAEGGNTYIENLVEKLRQLPNFPE